MRDGACIAFNATAQILGRPARDDARLGQRRALSTRAIRAWGVGAAEERDVQEAWTSRSPRSGPGR